MPVDASVYGMFKPVDFGAAMERGFSMAESSNRLSDLARQRKLQQKQLDEEDAYKGIVAQNINEDGSLNTNVLSGLAKAGLGHRAVQLQNDLLERRMKEANIEKALADAKTDPEMKKLTLDNLRADIAKKRAEANKAGKGPGYRELPADKVLSVNEGNNLPGLLTDISATIEANQDMFGPIKGRWNAANPYNEKAQTMDSQIRASSQAFGRYMEGGVLRKEDEDKYRKMFPNMSDEPGVAKNKLAIVERLLSQKQNSNIGALRDQGFDVSGVDKGLTVPGVPSVLAGNSEKPGNGGGIIKDAKAGKQWDSVETNPKYFEAMKFIKANPNHPRAKEMLEKLKGGT